MKTMKNYPYNSDERVRDEASDLKSDIRQTASDAKSAVKDDFKDFKQMAKESPVHDRQDIRDARSAMKDVRQDINQTSKDSRQAVDDIKNRYTGNDRGIFAQNNPERNWGKNDSKNSYATTSDKYGSQIAAKNLGSRAGRIDNDRWNEDDATKVYADSKNYGMNGDAGQVMNKVAENAKGDIKKKTY